MKNKPVDLNNHLFAQLERLGDEDLSGDDLKQEIERVSHVFLLCVDKRPNLIALDSLAGQI